MKKLLFLTSHYGSGYKSLFKSFDQSLYISGSTTEMMFDHPQMIYNFLEKTPHKNDTALATHMIPLLTNLALTHKEITKFAKFIYLIRPPLHTLHEIVDEGISPQIALDYYMFRMRRITQLAEMTPGAVLLTWNNIMKKEGVFLIKDYLDIPDVEYLDCNAKEISNCLHLSWVDKAQKMYDKHYGYMCKLNLRKVD